jgi:hypothetical protein
LVYLSALLFPNSYTAIPQLTKIIRSRITFIRQNVISHRFL